VGLFVCVTISALVGAVVFLMIKKRTFAEYTHITLSSESAVGLNEGMPLLYSGFEIGTIAGLTLNDDGLVIIDIEVPAEHERRITETSRFFIEKPVIGLTRLIVETEKQAAPPPAADHVFPLEIIDEFNGLISKLPVLTEKIDRIAENIESMTADNGALNQSIRNVSAMTGRLADDRGVEVLVGEASGKELRESITYLNRSLKKATALLAAANQTLRTAEEKVLGQEGTVSKLNGIADDISAKLKALDALVESLVVIGGNVEDSTTNLSVLRSQIDLTINSANALIKDIRNKLPMKQQKEVPLP
jgi:phospholipid/cholesterol/gamma-HCH transport system substrate-binding protein